jgi:DNA polymerase-1
MPETLFLVDGSNNLYRCYYAIRNLSNSSGLSTNAVYGFTQMLRKLLKEQKPDLLAVAFDEGTATFRHQKFVDYKSDRKPMPDDLKVQVPLVNEVVEAFGIPIVTSAEYEADDLLGSLACTARDRGYRVVLATSDKDFFQLVGDNVLLFHTTREQLYDEEKIKEVFGLAPSQVADVMAIWGDAIDNIPGVPGIGEKGAKSLIEEFGSLDNLLANLDKVKKKSHREALEQHREQALLSRELATIRCDLEVAVDFDKLRMSPPDRERLHSLFAKLEFHSLMQEYMPEAPQVERSYRLVTDAAELRAALGGARRISLHLEPAGEASDVPILAAGVSVRPNEALVVPLDASVGGTEELRSLLREVLAGDIELVAHDVKQQLRRLEMNGWPVPARIADTMLMSYVLNPGAYSHAFDNVARERLTRDVTTRKAVSKGAGTQIALGAQPIDDLMLQYLGERSDIPLVLAEMLEPELRRDADLVRIYETLELPLVPVLTRMERRGIRIDLEMLHAMSQTMGAQIAELEKKIYAEAGEEFNINSPAQLSVILFEKLQYPVLKKTQKTKSSSTGMEVLKDLASHGYAVPQLILEHRELHKLKSTYVDALPQLVGTDRRVRSSFNQAVAATGRLSSSDPNLQNIPIRTEQGREIRRAFVADEGKLLLSADYSQIELRILAHMTEDPDLIEAFRRGADIHRATAARIFNVAEPLVTTDQRRAVKVINFGVLYGMSAFRLSNELDISTAEAKEFIDAYFGRYPRIQEYLDRTLDEARRTGSVRTLFGRVRHIPEIHNRSFTVRGNAERMATNAPIQGTAADLLKLAMIRLDERLAKWQERAAMLLTVHDEIVLEVAEEAVEEVAGTVRETMESVYELAVPLAVELHWGKSWFEAKE